MKERKAASILILIIILVILIGIAITVTRGLNFSLIYSANQRLDIYISSEFNVSDIEQIASGFFEKEKIYIQESTSNSRIISITARSITSDEEDAVINEINTKYNITIDKSQYVQLGTNANIRGRDIIYPYIYPVLLASALCLVYLAIRFRKIGLIKVLAIVGIPLVVMQALYLSVLAIGRIPINRLAMPIALTIYILTMLACTVKLEKMLAHKKEDSAVSP